MNSFDILVLIVLAGFLVNGVRRGFFLEVLGLAGVIGGIFAGIIAAGWLSNLILDYMPDLPEIMVHLLSFTALFVGFYYLGRMLASMLEATFKRMSLDWLNRLSGGLVASAKGAILLSLLFMYIAFLPLQKTLAPWQKESVLHEPLYDLVPTVYKKIGSPEDLPEKVREILEKSRERIIEDALKEIEDDIRDQLD